MLPRPASPSVPTSWHHVPVMIVSTSTSHIRCDCGEMVELPLTIGMPDDEPEEGECILVFDLDSPGGQHLVAHGCAPKSTIGPTRYKDYPRT